MSDLIVVINDTAAIESVSEAAAAAFGYSAAELVGRPSQLILAMPDRPSVIKPPFVWLSASAHPILHAIHRDGRRIPHRLTQHEIHGRGETHYVLLLEAPDGGADDEHDSLRHQHLYQLATFEGRISVWEVDYRTNHFEFSPAMGHMLGLSESQIPTSVDGWKQRFHPDDWRLIEREAERMLHREIPELNVEARMLHADGRTLWGLVRGKAFFDADGNPIKSVGTMIDITERRHAEQRASIAYAVTRVLAASPNIADASRLILQAICEALDWEVGALWRVDNGAQVLRCIQTWSKSSATFDEFESISQNTTFASGIGLPGRVWANPQSAWVPDVTSDANFPRARVAAKVGLHAALAFPILLENTVLGAMEFFSKEIKQPDEVLLQLMGTIGSQIGQFIERKKAEQERDLFFDLSLDLLCIADLRGFSKVNPAFCKTLGYAIDELTSRPFLDFVHPDDVQATVQVVADLERGKDVVFFENRYRCKDGTYRWLSWKTPAPKPGSDQLYAIARDVTDAKRVQADLNHALEQAENANRAKSDFLSRMSHELRTPLNAILGFGQLLQRDALSPRQREQIDMVVKAGRHLLMLINEVLDITRIEVGRLDISSEPVDLSELLREVIGLTQPLADARNIQLHVDPSAQRDCHVVADKQRLKQVLLNLISNAIKYNYENGRVVLRSEITPQGRLRLHVQDTGPGIPREMQHRLFVPFDRLGAESTAIEGSGLGLVLSRRLVEIMGGTLSFVSQPESGSTFTVELPIGQCALAVAAVPTLPSFPEMDVGPARTLLCIEDNHANIRLIEAVLASRPNLRLLTAMQASVGLEMARTKVPDLILLDVHLPDMNGDDLLALLRADAMLRTIPVVVISADATARQIDRLLSAGASEYITKPIDVDQLLQILDRYLKEPRTQ